MASKKRYAVVGTGGRCIMFIDPIAKRFSDTSELVALCDISQGKMDYHNNRLEKELGYKKLPTYKIEDFQKMVQETKPDTVIVTTVDAYHHEYIIKAMELGCDAITEKPMTINDANCRAIIDTAKRTGRNVRVTFNYRWGPGPTEVKRQLLKGIIGDIVHVDFEYRLNTSHGADYFRRWHREKDKSGGLLVHKSTHHFDIINWWIDAVPEQVFGYGRLAFYGKENARKRGVDVKYDRYTGNDVKDDPFALTLDDGMLKDLYKDTESDSGYVRDRNVFGDNITIEDTMSLLVKYRTGTVLNYSLNAYVPTEGFYAAINGTKGRLEYREEHGTHILGEKKGTEFDVGSSLRIFPMFGNPYEVEIPKAEGGHGGADPLLAEQIFSPSAPKEVLGRNASWGQGAASILIGIAGNQCFKTGLPVTISDICPQLGNAKQLHELP